MKMRGPYKFEMEVFLVDDDGNIAKVTLNLGEPGNLPTKELVDEAINDTLKQIPDEFRLMNKSEFFNELASEKTGHDIHFATPGGEEWDDD